MRVTLRAVAILLPLAAAAACSSDGEGMNAAETFAATGGAETGAAPRTETSPQAVKAFRSHVRDERLRDARSPRLEKSLGRRRAACLLVRRRLRGTAGLPVHAGSAEQRSVPGPEASGARSPGRGGDRAAVDERYADARAARVSPGPSARDSFGPVGRDRDAVDRASGKAPRRQASTRVGFGPLGHTAILSDGSRVRTSESAR